MHNPDSFSHRVRDSEQRRQVLNNLGEATRRYWQALAFGAVLGLFLGLFIGWYLWPVQYTTAWPSELDPEAKAQYIAAVADAYAAARNERTAQLAGQRLDWFGAETEAELTNARTFYDQSDLADSSIQIANIEELALALDLSLKTTDVGAESAKSAPASADDVPPATSPASADPITPTDSGVPEWLRLGLWMLAAFVLIAGGIWVLRTVMRTPLVEDDVGDEDEIDEFDDHDYVQPGEPDRIDEMAAASTLIGDSDQTDYDLDRDASGTSDADDVLPEADLPPVDSPSTTAHPQTISVTSGSAGAVLNSVASADLDGYGFEPESESVQQLGRTSTIIIEDIIEDVDDDEIVTAGDEPAGDAGADERSTSEPDEIERSSTTPGSTSTSPVAAGIEVAIFTARFQPSLDEYEEAFTIEDQDGYIGDCGMGVNMKHGLVRHNPEHVSVLDVWLVDLAQEAQMSFHSMSLVSQHGIGNELPQKLAEEDERKQMMLAPKAGETFQLVGRELLIDCEVVAARYAATGQVEGVFVECEIAMAVSRRA